jgi:hypothetical protein
MGLDVRHNWAITLPAMHELLKLLEREWNEETSDSQLETAASLGAFSIIAFCASLRGSETYMVDLKGLIKHQQDLTRMNKHDMWSSPFSADSRGPFPTRDLFGYRVAIGMVLKSLEP